MFEKKGTDFKLLLPLLHDPKFSPSSSRPSSSSAGSAFPPPSSILFMDQLLPHHISTGIPPSLAAALLKTTFLLSPSPFSPPSIAFSSPVLFRLSLTPLLQGPDFNRANKAEKERKRRVKLSPSGGNRGKTLGKLLQEGPVRAIKQIAQHIYRGHREH